MKFGSVCSGIEAASMAFNPLGWKAVAFSEIEPLNGLIDFFRCFAYRKQVCLLQFFGMGKPVAIGAKNDAVGKRVRSAIASFNDVVGIARGFIPAAAHALVAKHSAQSLHPTASICVNLALGENVGLPFVPRGDAGTVPPVFGKSIHGAGLPCVMSFDKSARPTLAVHRRHFSLAPALAKSSGDDQSFPVLVALKVFPGTSIGSNGRNFCSATTRTSNHIHKSTFSSDKGLY